MKFVTYMDTELGILGIAENGQGISDVFFDEGKKRVVIEQSQKKNVGIVMEEKETPLLLEAVKQLKEYFQQKRKEFSLPLSIQGTEFQLEDWNALCSIPYGETRSYQQIARQIGRPKACRAVGMANHCNPICILIPCHRVIGSNGKLVGYGGGMNRKEKLLQLEGIKCLG